MNEDMRWENICPDCKRHRRDCGCDKSIGASESGKVIATWSISLDCECPHCKEYVDVTGMDDFWCDGRIAACEYGTKRSDSLRVVCPECKEEFNVKCEY